MKAYVWQLTKSDDNIHYALQIEGFTDKSIDAVANTMESWRQMSYGFKGDKYIQIFHRLFNDKKEMEKWVARNFRWDIEYVTNNGLGHTTKMKSSKKTKRTSTCSNCGKKGHNARSCGKPTKVKKSKTDKRKAIKRRAVKCGNCGELGHNARTCKKK